MTGEDTELDRTVIDEIGGCYGKSITDPCLGWKKTERLLLEMAEQL